MNGEGFSIEMMHGNWRKSCSVTRISTSLRYSQGDGTVKKVSRKPGLRKMLSPSFILIVLHI